MLVINPTCIPDIYQTPLLNWLLNTKELLIDQKKTYDIPSIGKVNFSCSFIRVLENENTFEVFNSEKIWASGAQAKVYLGLGQLNCSDDISFSQEQVNVIKSAPPSNFSNVEKHLHRLFSSFAFYPLITLSENASFLVMKKQPGLTLEKFLKEKGGSLNAYERFKLALTLIDSVIDVEKHHIFHRDVKPENIMVDYENQTFKVNLIDFGISEFYLSEVSEEVEVKADEDFGFKGTFKFAAPELYEAACYKNQADVYSVAMVMALIFGVKFKSLGMHALPKCIKYANHMNYHHSIRIPDLPPGITTQLKIILNRMSDPYPASRYSLVKSKSDLMDLFLRFNRGEGKQCTSPLVFFPRETSCWLKDASSTDLFEIDSGEEVSAVTNLSPMS